MSRSLRIVLVAFTLTAASASASALAQAPPPPPAERWALSYDRVTAMQVQMHGPRTTVIRPERSRLVLSPSKGDSLTGQLVLLATDSSAERQIGEVRGVKKKNELTLTIYKLQKPMGFFASQWDAMMTWMKETMHGVTPTYTKLQLTIAGDSVKGTRSVLTIDGASVDGPRPVLGRREKP
jgi:hypothetical protein